MFVFGSGVLIGTPQGGTPINFGLAQEMSLNVATSTKALYGQYNFPVAIGSGTRKMTGKAKLARISGQALGALFFGVAPSVGATQTQFGEAASVPSRLALHVHDDQPRDLRRRSGRRLRRDRAAAEAGRLEPGDRAIFGLRRRLHVRRRRRRRGGADLLHLHGGERAARASRSTRSSSARR